MALLYGFYENDTNTNYTLKIVSIKNNSYQLICAVELERVPHTYYSTLIDYSYQSGPVISKTN